MGFCPFAITVFSGDTSRTEKASLGKLTHGLLLGEKKNESILIFLKANWGMKPQTEIGRGKPTIKIAKGKGSKFLLYLRVESLYFGAWIVAVAGSVPGLLSLTAVSGPERRPMLDQGMKDLMETSHLHQVNQDINKLDAYLLSYTPHTVKCRTLFLVSRTCPCG